MKINNKIAAMLATIGIMTACSDDIFAPAYTVGEADNAIVLRAGISEGGAGVMTRAAEDHHSTPGHKVFTSGTQLRLRVDGTWLGKADGAAPHGTITGTTVSQKTTATVGDETVTDSKHNAVTFTSAEQLYWDDYGTADPANMSLKVDEVEHHVGNGRDRGLDIFAAAVDGITTAPAIADDQWTALPWNVGTPIGTPLAISQAGGWSTRDLLTCNNIKHTDAEETTNAYKFSEHETGKLLEFTHAMTKVTVNLTAGEGFPGYTTDPATAYFEAAPTVTLLGFNYTGTVNVEGKTSTPTAAPTNIQSRLTTGGANSHTASYDALVFPGNQFPNATDILKIVADGNTYYVNATKINAANPETNDTFEQGKNYIFNITVSKTKIVVTATIKDWIDVVADTETPKINVTADVGDATVVAATKDRMPSFDFYLSDAAGVSPTTAYTRSATATKPTGGADGATAWTFDTPLYWPNHTTHYLMRGVSPTSTTVAAGKISVAAADYSDLATAAGNLLVGAPVITSETMCGNTDHTQVDMASGGICAREGKINLTFDYMMAQLEVHLTTSSDGAAVNLTNAKVEVVGGYTAGEVDIHAKTTTTTGEKTDFTVNYITGEDANYRHSFVVPQELTYSSPRAETNLRFKVTIYKDGTPANGVDDIYYADIRPIQVSVNGDANESITTWDKGKHYIYVLDINKTAINTTATITDWVTVTASDTVWF